MDEFIELDYTGTADGIVFDTTRKQDAPGAKGPFEPVVVKLGIGQLLPGLDAFLQGKQPGNYEVTLKAEEAFGKKDPKLLKLVPLTAFGKEAKQLEPGMPVTIGEQHATVKNISGGRVIVDFNHPLAGKTVHYSLQLHGFVTDNKKKVDAVLKAMLGTSLPVAEEEGKIIVSLPKGFPAEGLVKEIEKHAGVTVTIKEIELPKSEHAHEGHEHHSH